MLFDDSGLRFDLSEHGVEMPVVTGKFLSAVADEWFSSRIRVTDAQSTVALSPLNVLAGATADQTFTLSIDKSANGGVDFSTVQDVLLGIDYTATV